MLRNIRVYDYFLDNIKMSFKMRRIMISLFRTFIYNFGKDKTIYYRKRGVNPRKMFLVGKDKYFKSKGLDLNKINYRKYKMRNINDLINEYVVIINDEKGENKVSYDIAKKYISKPISIDSVVHKEINEEMVMMYFNGRNKKKLKNVFWINDINKYNGYNKSISA